MRPSAKATVLCSRVLRDDSGGEFKRTELGGRFFFVRDKVMTDGRLIVILIWFWSSASLCVFICLNLIRFFSVSCAGKAVGIILEKLQSQCHLGKCVYEL